jgi:membrane associated rhomboid family serine protease
MDRWGKGGMSKDHLWAKFRYVFLPLPILAAFCVISYSLVDWLLVSGTGFIPLDEDIAGLWLPLLVAGVLVAIFIAPRLRILALSEKRNIPFLFLLVAFAAIAGPTILAQSYIRIEVGKVIHVSSLDAVGSAPTSKYYFSDLVCLDRQHAVAAPVADVTGKHNETLAVTLYVDAPVCHRGLLGEEEQDAWIGFEFHDTIDNRISEAAKDKEYRAFAARSQSQFFALDATKFQFFERVGINADRRGFENTLRTHGIATWPSAIILIPHTEPFNERAGTRLQWFMATLGTGLGIWFLMVMLSPLNQKAIEGSKIVLAEKESSGFARLFLLPSPENYGLPLLIDINILVFLAMAFSGIGVISFQVPDLIAWGGNYGPALHGIGILRLIASQFVHAGIMHLANNMYGLLIAGLFLLPVAKSARLIICYLLCGLGANVASVAMHPEIVSVGASGSIFGLFGILLSMTLLRDKRIAELGNAVWINAAIFVGFNLLLGMATPGIDNAAHIGGLATGLALGLVLYLYDRAKTSDRMSG